MVTSLSQSRSYEIKFEDIFYLQGQRDRIGKLREICELIENQVISMDELIKEIIDKNLFPKQTTKGEDQRNAVGSHITKLVGTGILQKDGDKVSLTKDTHRWLDIDDDSIVLKSFHNNVKFVGELVFELQEPKTIGELIEVAVRQYKVRRIKEMVRKIRWRCDWLESAQLIEIVDPRSKPEKYRPTDAGIKFLRELEENHLLYKPELRNTETVTMKQKEQPSPKPAFEQPKNQILYGPPGTGKTWRAVDLALSIVVGAADHEEVDRERFEELRFDFEKRAGQIAIVTFHQNYAYEDFIEGIRPVLNKEKNIDYELRRGIFTQIADVASEQPNRRFVLIIDEINRGNIAKIFGELITLIEDTRRIGGDDQTKVTLPYSGDLFGVPKNLYLIGTMNTADRSIQLLDTALRRRFSFEESMPDPRHEKISRDIKGIDCTKMLATMNDRINKLLDREHQIGHTYLMGVDDIDRLAKSFQNHIFPLLQEYFFDDWTKIRAVLGENAFVSVQEMNSRLLDPYVEDDRIYDRLPKCDDAWLDPSEYRKIYEGQSEAQ